MKVALKAARSSADHSSWPSCAKQESGIDDYGDDEADADSENKGNDEDENQAG